ncbi:hypothetical protein TGAM01_v208489, partial [Trichoderma gamsii]
GFNCIWILPATTCSIGSASCVARSRPLSQDSFRLPPVAY